MTGGLSAYEMVAAPGGTTRLIPSRFPPVQAFEDVSTADDMDAVFELEGWTNDRIAAPRLSRLDRADWVYGRPNASVVMAAFLHGSPTGMRFSGPELGAWYASTELMTSVLEVANGMRKEIALSAIRRLTATYRQYLADLGGRYVDITGQHPEFHDPDDASYPVPQAFGRRVRDEGEGLAGLRYDSVRRPGHDNWVCFRPTEVREVTQAGHFEIDVPATGKVAVRTLKAA